jgi:hypothetical protein
LKKTKKKPGIHLDGFKVWLNLPKNGKSTAQFEKNGRFPLKIPLDHQQISKTE